MLDQLKSRNIADILIYLLSHGSATKSDLVRGTTLGNSTVSDAINELTALKLVRSIGKEDSIGGRRSTIYEISKSYGCFIGIAFCDDKIEFVVTDCRNEIVKAWRVGLNSQLSAISILLHELSRIVVGEKNVLGIGVGLHGEIDYGAQIVTYCANPHWQHVHLKEIIERELLTFTIIDHYANGAALMEKYLGVARNIDDFIYHTVLAPQKMAVFLDGNICRGKNNMAGRLDNTEFTSDVAHLQHIWDVEKVFIADAKEYDLARGMAISAEVKWFGRALKR